MSQPLLECCNLQKNEEICQTLTRSLDQAPNCHYDEGDGRVDGSHKLDACDPISTAFSLVQYGQGDEAGRDAESQQTDHRISSGSVVALAIEQKTIYLNSLLVVWLCGGHQPTSSTGIYLHAFLVRTWRIGAPGLQRRV